MLQLSKLFGSSAARDDGPRPATSSARDASSLVAAVSAEKNRAVIAEGGKHFAAGRHAQALYVVDQALVATPDDATLLFARGSTFFAWGRFQEALHSFERAAAVGMVDFDLDMQLGWTCVNLRRLTEAEANFRRGATANPDSEEACIALANVLEMRGTLPAEAADFERRLSRWPKNYNGLMLLAACRFHQQNQTGGTAAYREAISLDPTQSRAWANLGVVLSHEEQFDEALSALQRAYEIDTANGNGESALNFATVLREVGRIDDALGLLGRNLLQNPDPTEHWLRSVFLLEAGRFTEGWMQHEFRWMREPLASARWTIRRPVWAGQDLRDKTILLHPEQGLGDAIQFIRYARLLKDRGARVVFNGFKDLGELARDFDDVDHVPASGALESFDYHIPLLSLPRVLGTTLTSIPAHVPYVKARPDYLERWAQRITTTEKLKVGIVWAGNPKHVRDHMRSVPLAQLRCLAQIDGLQLYSLQKSQTAAADIAASGLDLIDLGQHFDNLCDTAAAISHLDLVISVDTSVAHLAGALAKLVWLMVADPPDWRWLSEGDVTPWYPTMRLFRQTERNQWASVVDEIASALRVLLGSRSHVPATCKSRDEQAADAMPSDPSLHERSNEPGIHPSLGRVGETRYGIVQYLPQVNPIADSLRYYGEYLHPQLELMSRFIRPGAWALDSDVGVGITTLFLAEAVGDMGHVLAFEGDRVLNQIARQNIAANRTRNVTLLMKRLGEQNEDSGSGAVPHRQAETMDWIDGLGLERLDWIRINDGARCREIVAGAQLSLWRFRPWIFMTAANDEELQACARATRDCGYQTWRVVTPLFNPANYNRRVDDIFGGKTALGLLSIPEEIEMDIEIAGCTAFMTD